MKKITLLLFSFITFSMFAQQKKFFQSSPEKLSLEQTSFFNLIGKYYPEYSQVKKIINIYDESKKVAESYIEYAASPNDCDEYLIVLQSNNKRLDYEYIYAVGNGNLISNGSIYVLGDDVYEVKFSTKGKGKNFVEFIKNGNIVYDENPYKGLD